MINSLLQEYRSLVEQEKLIGKRKKELADKIKEHAMNNGVMNDKGSYYVENENFVFGSQAKKSIKLNEEKATTYLQERGLYEKATKVVTSIDEDKLEQLITDGEIPMEDFESLVDTKVTYAVDVKVKEVVNEDMPEVAVSNSTKQQVKKMFKKLR